jgi:hypothetical protein
VPLPWGVRPRSKGKKRIGSFAKLSCASVMVCCGQNEGVSFNNVRKEAFLCLTVW